MDARIWWSVFVYFCLVCGLAAPVPANAQTAEEDQGKLSLLPVTIELGVESFDDFLLDDSKEDENARIDVDSDDVPVIRFVTPTKILGCAGKEMNKKIFKGGGGKSALATSVCLFGIGIRGVAATRLVRGNWEPIVVESEAFFFPRFKYRQSPIGAELIMGGLSNISPLWSLGIGAGVNFYDLLIRQDDRILLETSDIAPFFYGVATLDLAASIHALCCGDFGQMPWGFVLRRQTDLECGNDRCNAVDVSNLPGGDHARKPIFLDSQSWLLVVSFPF